MLFPHPPAAHRGET